MLIVRTCQIGEWSGKSIGEARSKVQGITVPSPSLSSIGNLESDFYLNNLVCENPQGFLSPCIRNSLTVRLNQSLDRPNGHLGCHENAGGLRSRYSVAGGQHLSRMH